MKPFLAMASAVVLVSASALIWAFTSDGKRASAASGAGSGETDDDSGRWLDFWSGLDRESQDGADSGFGAGAFPYDGPPDSGYGAWGAEGDVENALGELHGAVLVADEYGYGTISMGTYYGYGGWGSSSDYWWNRYNWLRRYYWKYYKKHASGWKRQWAVPDSSGRYYTSMPGSFGLYDPAGNGWGWQVDDLDDAVPASEPVSTDSTVSVVFVSPRVGVKTGAAAYIRSFDRNSGTEIFSQPLPHHYSSLNVTESEGEIAVETCYGAAGSCDIRTYSI
jgi:hypothetical protein